MTEAIVVAIIVSAGTLLGTFLTQRKNTALITYRIDQLEKKVEKHNSIIERTYKLEQRCAVIEQKIRN